MATLFCMYLGSYWLQQLQEEVEWFVVTVVAALPASVHHLKQYKNVQDDDSTQDMYMYINNR